MPGYLTQTQLQYYTGNSYGGYQYISLGEVIDNFKAAYVGKGKILENVLSADVSFHAHRALAELTYDTLRSCKSQEIEVCPNLKMPLPHDYVNYVKLTSVDSNGIEHVLYPTSKTSNPFAIEQTQDDCDDCGDSSSSYNYQSNELKPQEINCDVTETLCEFNPFTFEGIVQTDLKGADDVFKAVSEGGIYGHLSQFHVDEIWDLWKGQVDEYCNCLKNSNAEINCGTYHGTYDLSSIGQPTGMQNFGWSNLHYPFSTGINPISGTWLNITTDVIHSTETSNAWDNYKSSGGNSVAIDQSTTTSLAVDADNYFQNTGQRYGIDPQYAQANGSFFIDCARGMIHFSSNLSGKTIILKYISDSLGTDSEMVIPKLAEEAIYKWIIYGCLSARTGIPGGLLQLAKKEKFAETRKAKIRLSNIKIEEISQVFRGKSKWIKH